MNIHHQSRMYITKGKHKTLGEKREGDLNWRFEKKKTEKKTFMAPGKCLDTTTHYNYDIFLKWIFEERI